MPFDTRPRRERRARPWQTLTNEERGAIIEPQHSVVEKASRFIEEQRRERRRLALRNKRRVRKGLQPLSMDYIVAERARQAAVRN